MGDYKKDVAALTIALNTNDAATIHDVVIKFQDYSQEQTKTVAGLLYKDAEVFFALKKSFTLVGAGAKDDDVCQWLYSWYQIDTPETRQFVLQFIPLLVWSYLYAISQNGNLPGIEACLLCVYNNEVVARNGQDLTFSPPTLSAPSYLHRAPFLLAHSPDPATGTLVVNDSVNLASNGGGLTENALKQFNKQAKVLVIDKSIAALETVTGSTRSLILKTALKKYNSYISYMPNASLQEYCKMCKRLVGCGFDFSRITPALRHSKAFADKYPDNPKNPAVYESDDDTSSEEEEDEEIKMLLGGTQDEGEHTTAEANGKAKVRVLAPIKEKTPSSSSSKLTKAAIYAKKPRIPLPATVMQELVSGLTFCVFRSDTHKRAVHACTLLHLRACHDLVPEVILSINSLLRLDANKQKEPSDTSIRSIA
jgi:hypothetical protein